MDFLADLEQLVDALGSQDIEYALCGGIAVNIYGHVRATRDIALLTPRDALERIGGAVAPLGYTLRSGLIPFATGTPEQREVYRITRVGGGTHLSLDLVLVTPVLEPVWASRTAVEWRGRRVPIVSLDGLGRMKRLAGRAQDLADLEALALPTGGRDP